MLEKILLIDDERNMGIPFVARTFDAGMFMLQHAGPWEKLWLDNDMGCGYGKEGRHILNWIEEQVATGHAEVKPARLFIVTMNSSARQEMEVTASRIYKEKDEFGFYHD